MPAYLTLALFQRRPHRERIGYHVLPVRTFTVRHALQWIGCGWRIWRKNLLFWWVPALSYLLFAFAVTRVPWVGTFFLLLLTPTMAAGVMCAVREQLNPNGERSTRYLLRRARSVRQKMLVLFGRPAHTLVRSFADEDKMLPLMGLGLVAAFGGVFAQMFVLNLGGAFYVTTGAFPDIGLLQMFRLSAAYAGMLTIYLTGVVVGIYLLSLFVLDNKPLGTALIASLRACMLNALPCLAYCAMLVMPLLLCGLIAKASPVIGFICLLGIGSVTLPLLMTSSYCASRLMFRAAQTAAKRSSSHKAVAQVGARR
ncbi:MAG: hypothetical protein QNJ82_08310 [Gammaproteobacteria bacterium]|nr:hypothetical protein [Gammaproteobacteria bacterium]